VDRRGKSCGLEGGDNDPARRTGVNTTTGVASGYGGKQTAGGETPCSARGIISFECLVLSFELDEIPAQAGMTIFNGSRACFLGPRQRHSGVFAALRGALLVLSF
jgi:hypothetical protein